MLGEVLIYVPSIARYRLVYLEERIAASRLAALAVEAAPDGMISPELGLELLTHAGVDAIALDWPEGRLMILKGYMPPLIDASSDLRVATPIGLMRDGFGPCSAAARAKFG